MTGAVSAMGVGGRRGQPRVVAPAGLLALGLALVGGTSPEPAASAEQPVIVFESPCVSQATGAATLREQGLKLNAASRLMGQNGEQLELWHSPDGRAWAAVIYLERDGLRCFISGAGRPGGPTTRAR
jgi:hypothetical protein